MGRKKKERKWGEKRKENGEKKEKKKERKKEKGKGKGKRKESAVGGAPADGSPPPSTTHPVLVCG